MLEEGRTALSRRASVLACGATMSGFPAVKSLPDRIPDFPASPFDAGLSGTRASSEPPLQKIGDAACLEGVIEAVSYRSAGSRTGTGESGSKQAAPSSAHFVPD